MSSLSLSSVVLMVSLTFACFVVSEKTAADDLGFSFKSQPDKAAVRKNSSWMSRLPDSVPLSRLSLPGTHDTCALHNGISFGFAKCQAWRLSDQLNAGVRFIDIRCRHMSDGFHIYHGIIDQSMSFEEVRNVCQAFLTQHPTECVVMSVKEEATAENNTRAFAETFFAATKNDGSLWHISHEIPETGTVRGKIVVVDRVGTLGGISWNQMQRQDDYQATLERKTMLIQSHFEKAMETCDTRWFVNFCSGTVPGSLLTPRKYAMVSNQFTLDFIQRHSRKTPILLGTVVMDFPSETLIEQILQTNFTSR